MTAEKIALHLRDHQTALDDWEYGNLVRELHRWGRIFDIEFKLDLPAYPVLKFAPLRNAYATYAWFRTELGTRDNITFNTNELARDPALILRTLCHELIHLWQHYHGTPCGSNYHNAEYRAKALTCGLIVEPQGCTSGHTVIFTEVLARHGVYVEPIVLAAEPRLWGTGRRNVKMKKWRCGCTTVRCAVDLDAVCLRCQQPFALA